MAVIVCDELDTLVGVPEITHVVGLIVRPEGSAGVLVQFVTEAPFAKKVEGLTFIVTPTAPTFPLEVEYESDGGEGFTTS